jgi:hypothetical protein
MAIKRISTSGHLKQANQTISMCMGDNDSVNFPQTIFRKPLHRRSLKVFAYIDDYSPISNARNS